MNPRHRIRRRREVRAVWPAVGGGVGLMNVDNAADRAAGRGEGRLQPRQILGGVIDHFLAEVGTDDIVASEQRFLQDGAGAAEGVEDQGMLSTHIFDELNSGLSGGSASSRLLVADRKSVV